jgi:hypothetical protein
MSHIGDLHQEKTDTESDEHDERDKFLRTLRANMKTVKRQLEEKNEIGKTKTGNKKGKYNKSIKYMQGALNKINNVLVKEFDGEVRHYITSRYIGGALHKLPLDVPRDLENSMLEIQRQLRLTFDENRSECQGYLKKIYEYESNFVWEQIYDDNSNDVEGGYFDVLQTECSREEDQLNSLDQSTSTVDELVELKIRLKKARITFNRGFEDEMTSLEDKKASLERDKKQYKENAHRMDQILEMSTNVFQLLHLCIQSLNEMINVKEREYIKTTNGDQNAMGKLKGIEPDNAPRDSKEEDKGETGDSKTENQGTPVEAHTASKPGLYQRLKNWLTRSKQNEATKKLLMDLKALEMSIDQV